MGVVLDGVAYLLDVHWNGRAEAWYMDLLDEEADPIHMGMKLILGTALGKSSVDPRFPPGILAMSDLSNTGVDASYTDVTTRVALYYYSLEELLG
jgi:hypothetical protein